MILQRIEYPQGGTFEEELYVRRTKSGVSLLGEEHKVITHGCYDEIAFNTYFNTFSVKKWRKYTNIQNIKLELTISGMARVILTTFAIAGFNVDEEIVFSQVVNSDISKQYTFAYPACSDASALSFRVVPLSENVVISEGAYTSDVNPAHMKNVNLALAICTYRREDYVARNINMLREEVFSKADSMLHGHIAAFISDNGNTLQPADFSDEHIHLFANKNSGGSGGFSRAAIEALRANDFQPTHIILMDDDISFNVYALERAFAFLRIIKDEYQVNMLGGAMFGTDQRAIQHAAGETQTATGIIFNKAGYNMFNIVDVLRNEVEEGINYLGWWFCCAPVKLFQASQFSLPLFVQYDDIEFGLRNNNVPKITLNGICCWHIPFDKKWSAFKNYYTIRNRAIVNGMYFGEFTKKRLKRELLHECFRRTLQFSYNEANLALRGAEDYLKGLSWLIQQNPQELNAEVISLSDKLLPVDQLELKYDSHELKYKYMLQEGRVHNIVRKLTFNGWFLPASKIVTVEVDDPPLRQLYLAKKALKYDINSEKGIVATKSYKEAFAIFNRMLKVFRDIDKNFDKVNAENKAMHDSVTSEEFWKDFLEF